MPYARIPSLGLRIALALLVAALFVVGVTRMLDAGTSSQPAPEDAYITVEEIINIVETSRPNESAVVPVPDFAAAGVGDELAPGDGVRTHWNSEARIDVVVRDLRRISRTTPNTVWRIGQFAVDDDTIVELDEGKIFSIDGGYIEGHPHLHIVTPAGVASARGTWFSVVHSFHLGITELQCFRGICELSNEFGRQTLTDEQKSQVTALTPPTRPERMTEADILLFTQLPEALSGEVPVPPLRRQPQAEPRPTPTPTPTPTPARRAPREPSAGPTPTPTPTPTATPTPEPTPTSAPTRAPREPTATPTPAPTPTETPQVTDRPRPERAPVEETETESDEEQESESQTMIE